MEIYIKIQKVQEKNTGTEKNLPSQTTIFCVKHEENNTNYTGYILFYFHFFGLKYKLYW